MPTTQLTPGANVTVDFSGVDAGSNPAPITSPSVDISDHSLAYAVLFSPTRAIVVARGPLGNFNLLINAKDAMGVALPTATVPFASVVGSAIALVTTVGTPQPNDITTPPIPVGW